MLQSKSTVLVLGANGRFGHHTALAFANAGWRVKAQTRADKPLNPELAGHRAIEALNVDLSDRQTLLAQGADCAIIVNGLHPPYRLWADEVPKLTNLVLYLARQTGAAVILPGNVYVYGDQMPELLSAKTPHLPSNQLGEIRSQMEQQYRDASADGVQTLLLRVGDFLQREESGNWFDTHMIGGLAKGRFAYPGRRDVPHAFGYLPDVARACVELAQIREQLPAFADIPFEGTTLTGDQLHQLVARSLGRKIKMAGIPWPIIKLMALFNRDMRGVVAMRYLWDTPHRLSGAELQHLLPDFRPTPVEAVIANCVSRFVPEPEPGKTSHQPLTIRH